MGEIMFTALLLRAGLSRARCTPLDGGIVQILEARTLASPSGCFRPLFLNLQEDNGRLSSAIPLSVRDPPKQPAETCSSLALFIYLRTITFFFYLFPDSSLWTPNTLLIVGNCESHFSGTWNLYVVRLLRHYQESLSWNLNPLSTESQSKSLLKLLLVSIEHTCFFKNIHLR